MRQWDQPTAWALPMVRQPWRPCRNLTRILLSVNPYEEISFFLFLGCEIQSRLKPWFQPRRDEKVCHRNDAIHAHYPRNVKLIFKFPISKFLTMNSVYFNHYLNPIENPFANIAAFLKLVIKLPKMFSLLCNFWFRKK